MFLIDISYNSRPPRFYGAWCPTLMSMTSPKSGAVEQAVCVEVYYL